MLGACWKSPTSPTSGSMSAIKSIHSLGFPFECESPFLFAVYHLDRYPPGNESMGPNASLKGRSLGSDFGNPSGWSMYHGQNIPGFPKHPHRGFETITVTRRGVIDHTDSLGNAGRFGYGDVQWMTAGRGINHSEMFPLLNTKGENMLELFQIWINLPKKSKMVEPSFKMLWAESLPRVKVTDPKAEGVEITLIAGELPGADPPPSPPPESYAMNPTSDVLILTVKLPAGTSWVLPGYSGPRAADGLHRNAYLYAGGPISLDGQQFDENKRVKLQPTANVQISAVGASAVEVLVLQGRDIGEPVVQHGPFVGNSREDIAQAFKDYHKDEFGGWPWPSGSLAHPRDSQRFAKYADGRREERSMP